MNLDLSDLNSALQRRVTFTELEAALMPVKDASPPAFVVGLLYGSICAPHLVPPSVYLPHIIGERLELPDPQTADRLIALLRALHNQLAEMIEDDQPLSLRRAAYEPTKDGLLLHVQDLGHEVDGFKTGLFLGVEQAGEPTDKCLEATGLLTIERHYLKSVKRSIHARKKPWSADAVEARRDELVSFGKRTGIAMQVIATSLYRERMRKYRALDPTRIGRNDPCPCGSGKKFKHCCLDKLRPSNPENN